MAGRIVGGVGANFAGNAVTALIQIVSVPVFLSAWGIQAYGEWLVLSALPTYVALSNLSFASVAGNSMVMAEAQGNRTEAVHLGRSVWAVVTSMNVVAVLVAIILAIVFAGALGSGAPIPAQESRIVLTALFLQVVIGNQYGVLDAWYRTGGQYPLGQAVRQVARLIEFGALAGTAMLGGTPAEAAVAFLAASAVGFAISWLALRKVVRWASFQPERPHLQTLRILLAPGLAFMAFPVGNALSIQGLRIVVGALLGPTTLVVFSTTRTMSRVGLQMMESIKNAIWPELSRAMGAGNLSEARSILLRATQAAIALSIIFLVVASLFGRSAIRWWTQNRVDAPDGLLIALLLVIVCETVWNTLSAVILATNQHARMAGAYLVGSALAVALAVVLTPTVGVVGAPVALLVIDLLTVVYVVPPALRIVGEPFRTFACRLIDIRGAMRSAVDVWRMAP